MAHTHLNPQHDEDDDIDPEGPDASEMDSSEEPDLEICPDCRRLISEEAHKCPHCGNCVSPGDEPMSRGAWVTIAIVAAMILVAMILSHL